MSSGVFLLLQIPRDGSGRDAHVDAFSRHGTMKPKQRPQVTDGGGGPRTAWNPREDLVWVQGRVLGRALRGGARQGGGLGVAGCAPGPRGAQAGGPATAARHTGAKTPQGAQTDTEGHVGRGSFCSWAGEALLSTGWYFTGTGGGSRARLIKMKSSNNCWKLKFVRRSFIAQLEWGEGTLLL